MNLTNAQKVTLKADILANPDLADMITDPNDDQVCRNIAAAYNIASASYYVWKNRVTPPEYRSVIIWTEVDTLNAGSARIWEWVTANMSLEYDPSDANIRQGLADAWAANTTTRGNLIAISKRFASRVEELFSTGTGTSIDPATMSFVGPLSFQDVCQAIRN